MLAQFVAYSRVKAQNGCVAPKSFSSAPASDKLVSLLALTVGLSLATWLATATPRGSRNIVTTWSNAALQAVRDAKGAAIRRGRW